MESAINNNELMVVQAPTTNQTNSVNEYPSATKGSTHRNATCGVSTRPTRWQRQTQEEL